MSGGRGGEIDRRCSMGEGCAGTIDDIGVSDDAVVGREEWLSLDKPFIFPGTGVDTFDDDDDPERFS
jgi:hypothetical protein